MEIIRVDINNITKKGYLQSNIRRSSGRLNIGDIIVANDNVEDIVFCATVLLVDNETGRVVLEVDWEEVQSDT